ncbi:DJ-1/PfpI family protein [Peribacillus butanolivorans]|uniref:DJ-1/PfpI family protein n=1 Tax=Peribacillus butanolivorans TaxID=421767 RepID=UPI00366ED17E
MDEKNLYLQSVIDHSCISAKTLEGRHATGYKSIKVDMEYAGATYIDKEVVVCAISLSPAEQQKISKPLIESHLDFFFNKV